MQIKEVTKHKGSSVSPGRPQRIMYKNLILGIPILLLSQISQKQRSNNIVALFPLLVRTLEDIFLI